MRTLGLLLGGVALVLAHGHTHDHDDHGHAHDHGHTHEKPASKYSREANEGAQPSPPPPKAAHSHSHSHTKPKAAHLPSYDPQGPLAFLNDQANAIWTYSILSTIAISMAPFFILFLIPVQAKSEKHADLLKVLLSFASGGLLGDAFLHLIPHAIEAQGGGHSHSHSHDEGHSHDLSVGLWVLAGLCSFLAVEKLVRIARGGEGHSHSHAPPAPKKEGKKKKAKNSDDEEEEDKAEDDAKVVSMKVTGWLNLAADACHNFTDGLAIGASYLAGINVGLVTTFTVLLHEVPHEIGDFAILVQSGCSKKKAMLLQLTTAVGAMMGTLVSLYASDPSGVAAAAGASWVLPFTAGGFIYIATVSVIPEILEDSGLWQSIKEMGAMAVGIAMMVGISWME